MSTNIHQILGRPAAELIGSVLSDHLRRRAVYEVQGRLQLMDDETSVERLFGLQLTDASTLFDLAIHKSGRSVVIEIERHAAGENRDYDAYVRPMVERINKASTVEQLCSIATRQLKTLTGFDRVMAYRFAPDGSGQVIAEAKQADMEAFLGLRYPASDIPQQARALYLRNPLRIISDVEDPGVPIEPVVSPSGEPLDLSMSTTRAVSPVHLEYLRNMGVAASMSVSIIKRGKLWGLFACHHNEPRILTYEIRSAAELFGQLFAFVLDQKEVDAERQEAKKAQSLHDVLMMRLAEGQSIAEHFGTVVDAISTVISFDGAVAWVDGEFKAVGLTPTQAEFTDLLRFLNTTTVSKVYTTDSLSRVFAPAANYADRAAGLLVLPLSRSPRDYIVLFRQELVRTVIWAGAPSKPVESDESGVRLSPRKSFQAWQEVVRNRCADWSEGEIRAAEALRMTMLEVVLRLKDASVQESAKQHERQELLIAELNHRVRNILNLIQGLVSQSGQDAVDVASFTGIVEGRIHALARAHDQITKRQWNAAPVRTMIETEVAAYMGALGEQRVSISGPDALLVPNAYTTVSLAIHEIITNAAKYGALSVVDGRVEVGLALDAQGNLTVSWRERGGPPVKPPSHKGFGSTLIERSIPHELQGKAEIRYEPDGVQAEFFIPSDVVLSVEPARMASEGEGASVQPVTVEGSALLVEDNMIIAMDTEDLLKDLGVESVFMAGSVSEAMAILRRRDDIRVALLDVNLGQETSEQVARALVERRIGFAFATGYGETHGLAEAFSRVPVVQKPFDSAALSSALSVALSQTKA